jgi:hypothetical protein
VRQLLPHHHHLFSSLQLPLAPFPPSRGAAAMGLMTSESGRGDSEVHCERYLGLAVLQVIHRGQLTS